MNKEINWKFILNNRGEVDNGDLPPADPPADLPPDEPKGSEFSKENLPKTKDDWNALKEADLGKWGELTQANIDTLYRQNKELAEQKKSAEDQRDNIKVELDSRTPDYSYTPQVPVGDPTVYSIHNLPKTDEDWDDLSIDNPRLFTDLRTQYNSQKQTENANFTSAQAISRKSVQVEHPDMYLAELDGTGEPRKDENGKVVLKLDQASGEPIFNPNSEKGKLWSEIYATDQITGHDVYGNPVRVLDTLKDGPEVLMLRMNRRLQEKGLKMIDAARDKKVDEGQVIQDGVTPPPKKTFTYKSTNEQEHVKQAISRGVYKGEEEYFALRDNQEGIYDENRVPTFGKQ